LGAVNFFGGFTPWDESVPPVDLASRSPGVWRRTDLADSRHDHQKHGGARFELQRNLDWPKRTRRDQRGSQAIRQRTRIGDADRPEQLVPYFEADNKVILYHGYSDQAISPYRTIWFYRDLAELFGGYRNVQENARLFMALARCIVRRGPGPTASTRSAHWKTGSSTALRRGIIATKYVMTIRTGSGADDAIVQVSRESQIQGVGNSRDAVNWTCHLVTGRCWKSGRMDSRGLGLKIRDRDDDRATETSCLVRAFPASRASRNPGFPLRGTAAGSIVQAVRWRIYPHPIRNVSPQKIR